MGAKLSYSSFKCALFMYKFGIKKTLKWLNFYTCIKIEPFWYKIKVFLV